jgi:hypothetical protein
MHNADHKIPISAQSMHIDVCLFSYLLFILCPCTMLILTFKFLFKICVTTFDYFLLVIYLCPCTMLILKFKFLLKICMTTFAYCLTCYLFYVHKQHCSWNLNSCSKYTWRQLLTVLLVTCFMPMQKVDLDIPIFAQNMHYNIFWLSYFLFILCPWATLSWNPHFSSNY